MRLPNQQKINSDLQHQYNKKQVDQQTQTVSKRTRDQQIQTANKRSTAEIVELNEKEFRKVEQSIASLTACLEELKIKQVQLSESNESNITSSSENCIATSIYTSVHSSHLKQWQNEADKLDKLLKLFSGKNCKWSEPSQMIFTAFRQKAFGLSDIGLQHIVGGVLAVIANEAGIELSPEKCVVGVQSERNFSNWEYNLNAAILAAVTVEIKTETSFARSAKSSKSAFNLTTAIEEVLMESSRVLAGPAAIAEERR